MTAPTRKLMLALALALTACGPGQPFGPAATATPVPPTATPVPPTATPIPGIEAPLLVAGVSYLVREVKIGALPAGLTVKAGYQAVTVKLVVPDSEAGEQLLDQVDATAIGLTDAQGGEHLPAMRALSITTSGDSVVTTVDLFFGVPNGATGFALRLPDGQVIDLAPVMPQS